MIESVCNVPGAVKEYFARRPCLRQALLWSIPALLFGVALRIFLLQHSPYAYWSKDSSSYMDFAYGLLDQGDPSLDRKRRWVYPIFLVLPHALPGSTLQWVAVLQHTIALLATVAVAYMVRKIFIGWRWFIIPATLLYALHPHFIYFSDQVLGESLFVTAIIAAMAGWTAWLLSPEGTRARFSRFALFLVPFALMMLTKPSGRFYWPGLLAALVIVLAWRHLRWPHYIALVILLAITPTVGKPGQGLRLLYSSAFPLTQLQTPLHAEYKAEIAPMVREARSLLHEYYTSDKKFKNFLEYPADEAPDLELWANLQEDNDLKKEIYMDLALEGVLREPHLMVYIAWQRILGSHIRGLKGIRATGEYYAERVAEDYFYPKLSSERPDFLKKLFGLPRSEPLPPLEYFQRELNPRPDSRYDTNTGSYLQTFEDKLSLLKKLPDVKKLPPVNEFRLSWMGILALLGFVLAFLKPYYRTIGCWTILTAGYLFGVYAVGSMNGRFIIPALPLLMLLWIVPLDALIRTGTAMLNRRKGPKPQPG